MSHMDVLATSFGFLQDLYGPLQVKNSLYTNFYTPLRSWDKFQEYISLPFMFLGTGGKVAAICLCCGFPKFFALYGLWNCTVAGNQTLSESRLPSFVFLQKKHQARVYTALIQTGLPATWADRTVHCIGILAHLLLEQLSQLAPLLKGRVSFGEIKPQNSAMHVMPDDSLGLAATLEQCGVYDS